MAKKKKRPDYILQNGKVIKTTGASTSQKTDYVLENGKVKKTTSVSAPTKTTTTKKEKKDDILGMDFFQKGSFGDKKGNVVSDTITGVGNTGLDAGLGVVRGALSIVEGGKDLLTYGVAGLSDLVGADKFAKKAKEYAQQDDMEVMFGGIHDKVKNYSLLGDTSRSVTVGLGQIAPIILTGGLGASAGLSTVGTTALTTGVTGISSMGRGMSEAYNKDATDEEAIKYGIISGGIEAGTELLFGGLSKVGNALGVSRGIGALDDKLAKKLTQKMTNLYAKNFTEFGIKSMAEGTEELIAGVGNAFAKKITYMKEEDIKQLLQDENLLESFVVGTVTSGLTQSGYIKGMEGGSLREANKKGIDFITGYTQNEQAVFDKEVENRIKEKEKDGKTLTSKEKSKIYEQVERDIERGEIDTDTIESVLGGETLKKYKSIEEQEASLTKQLKELKQAPNTVGNAKQYETIEKQLNELKQNSNKTQLKEQLSKEVFEMTSNDARLRESYYEKARRGQDFEADLNKYDSKQREVVQKAIDSGILNNTRKTHEFVDFVAKLSVDKGIDFDFSDNERIRQRIRESGFAIGDDTVVNGFKSGNGVTINMQSGKALNTIVGHEITHVLEGTELYDSLASNVKEFAELKGIYQSMYDTAFENYKGVYEGMTEEEYKKAIEKEVTADLIGDYIFSDIDFVRNLSTKNRNVFDKVFNEIKYFLKTVNAGSDAEKQLLKAKKIFEDVYKETSNNASEDTKLSLSSIGNSFFGDPNIKSDAFTKTDANGVREYKKSEGYKRYVDQCVNNMRQTRSDFDETVARQDIEKQIDGIVRVAIASKKAGYDIFDYVDDNGKKIDVTDLKDSKGRLLFSSLEPNSEYTTSSDISTICDKSKNFQEIYDEIVRREEAQGVPRDKRFFKNVNNYFALHKIMADKGLTQPCRQCYVDSMRKNLTPMADAFLTLVQEENVNNKSNLQLFDKKGEAKANNTKLREKVLETFEEHPEYNMNASDLTMEMLTTEDGLAQLRLQAPLIYEAFNSFYGQSKPKMPKSATPFRFGELTALLTDANGKVKQSLIDKINSTGGFRLQSYSDFQIQNYTDVLQVIFEAGTLGLSGHAYTKVPAFLKATEGTNLKRNISVFMYQDGNEWKIDKNDSFPMELEEIYDIVNNDESGNTSIIVVSQNAENSAWIMANDNVGYGIPFHKSGHKMGTVRNTIVKENGREIKGYKNAKDHTKQQTEVWKDTLKDENGEIVHKAETKVKKGINIYEFWDFDNEGGLSKHGLIEKNIKAYIDACNEAGYLPKFREYVMNNSKVLNDVLKYSKELGTVSQDATIDDISFEYSGYRIPYGYYKFIGDFGMFTPQGEASPHETLSLKDYEFEEAVKFFKDAETVKRKELLQQFANDGERQKYTDAEKYPTEKLQEILNAKKKEVADSVIAPVQFSISQDTEGRQLTQNQQEYFKDSKVRDENGYLKPLYHGTESMTFTEFNVENGVWLSDDYEYAKEYSGWWNTKFYSVPEGLEKDVYKDNNLRIYELYANIKNPFDVGEINGTLSEGKVSDLANKLGHYVADQTGSMSQGGKTAMQVRNIAKDYIGEKAYNFTRTKEFMDYVKSLGFDGFKATEGGINTYCAFNSAEQVKLTINQNPTTDEDIRYSLSENNQDIAPNPQGIYSKDVLKEDIAPIHDHFVDSNNMMEEEMFAPPGEEESESEHIVGEDLTKKNVDRIRAIQSEIKGYQLTKDVTKKEFDEKIARKESEYESLTRKDTKKAMDLRNQITRLETRRDTLLKSLDNKIERSNSRIENIEKESRYEKRKSKQTEYRELFSRLIGDTSTWVDKKMGIQYQTNTLRRNLRDIVRDASGNRDIARADAIYDELQGSVNQNEAKKNRIANEVKKVFVEMKINNKESTYIQMLGELRHNPDTTLTQDVVDEFYNKNKDKIDVQKVDRAIDEARNLYDSLYDEVNAALGEHGFKEMGYRKGYFPHFNDPKRNWLARLLNWKVNNDEIPTDIAGLTEMFEPQRTWQSFDKHRTSDTTDYNFLKGLDNYVNGALDWIYHIEDIQKHRAFETEIRYRHSSEQVQKKIDEYRNNPMLDAEEVDALIQKVLKEANNPLNNFVTDLHTRTNILAGKKSSKDRNMESDFNRHAYSVMTNITNRVTANQVVGSISSAMTNFIPITQSWGQVNPTSSLVGMKETIQSYMKDDGVVAKSDFLTNRLAQNEALYKDAWDKIGDKVGGLMEIVDNFTSQTIWRSKYYENIKNGMTEEQAIKDADQFSENVIGGRSKGNQPTIFHAKNPVTKMLTSFQLEVANQYGYMFKDMPQDIGKEATGKLVKGYATMFVGAYVYNALYSALTGRTAALDPIRIIQEFIGNLGDDEEEDTIENVAGAIGGLASNVAEEIPFVGGLLGGGRIPISSALPYDASISDAYKDVVDGDWKSLLDEMSKPLYYGVLPMGGGQIRKSIQGHLMFSDKHPVSGSYTKSENLRFPVEDTIANRFQALLFGQYASSNAREYFDRGLAPLKEKQIQEYKDLELPIREYWDYREGLKKQETLEDKFEYVADMDVSVEQKNIMINNIVDRKEEVDMTYYDDFANYEEFDWYSKNTEKYNFLEANGVSYSEYKADKDMKERYDSDYSVYKNNPEKVALSKAITGKFLEYRQYMRELDEFRADKDANGKTISGSSKAKKEAYIQSLSLDAGQKMILHKSLFDSKEDKSKYNRAIIEYLDSRDDISYEEKITILEELDMKVHSDGRVTW